MTNSEDATQACSEVPVEPIFRAQASEENFIDEPVKAPAKDSVIVTKPEKSEEKFTSGKSSTSSACPLKAPEPRINVTINGKAASEMAACAAEESERSDNMYHYKFNVAKGTLTRVSGNENKSDQIAQEKEQETADDNEPTVGPLKEKFVPAKETQT